MRLELSDGLVVIALSRRNLLALIAKLDGHPAGSAKTLTYETGDGVRLVIRAEEDNEHYLNQERDSPLPGRLNADTDGAIRSG